MIIFSFLVCLLLLGGLGILSQSGAVSPYLAAAFTIIICTLLHLSMNGTLLCVIAVYICCSVLQTLGAKNGITAEQTAMLANRPLVTHPEYEEELNKFCAFFKVFGLLLLLLAPIPRPSMFVGPVVLLLVIALSIYAFRGKALQVRLALIFAQTLAIATLMALMDGAVANPMLGLIAGVSIPSIILARPRVSPGPDFYNDGPLSFLFAGAALFLALATPGYSLSCIVAGLFPNDVSRPKYLAFLDGAMEGWVLHSFCTAFSSGKTPLGDILGNAPFNLGDSTPSPYFLLLVGIAVFMGIAAAFKLSKVKVFELPSTSYRYTTVFALALQGFVTCGLWLIPLLGVGFGMFVARCLFAPDDDETLALSFLVPISIAA